MNPNGSNLVNLTADSEAFDGRASWRPDGRKIAFMSDRETPSNPTPPAFPGPDFEIFVMNADGSNPTQITFNDLDDEDPAWSPNGKRIVFQRDLDPVRGQADYDILTMKADGTRERNLTNSPGVHDFDPNWSPNGHRIAFTSDRDGDGEIYTMKPNGSRVRQLTFNDAPFAFDGDPNWSPDGRKIAFTSERDAIDGDALPGRDLHDARRRRRPDQADVRRSHRLPPGVVAGRPQDRLHQLPRCHRGGSRSTRRSTRCAPTAATTPTARKTSAFDAAPDWQPLDDHHDDDDHHGDDDRADDHGGDDDDDHGGRD